MISQNDDVINENESYCGFVPILSVTLIRIYFEKINSNINTKFKEQFFNLHLYYVNQMSY